MRLTRRRFLAGLGATGLGLPNVPTAIAATRCPITITTRPLDAFDARKVKTRFGQLDFRGGLVLKADHPNFGGFSGLYRSRNGGDLVALSDKSFWLTAKTVSEKGRIIRFEQAEIAAVLGASGRELRHSRYYDCESLAIADGIAYVSIERTHDILRFDWARDGVAARPRVVPVPPEIKRLPRNRGLEALGVVPAGHPLAGALIGISERSGKEDEPTLGAFIGGPRPGLFQVSRHDGFDITDLAFLPGGDLVLLERWYKPLRGVGMRIRRIAANTLRPGAILDGPYLIDADFSQEIDNMEGLAVHQDAGTTILSVISDDNFSFFQRTVLLEFALS